MSKCGGQLILAITTNLMVCWSSIQPHHKEIQTLPTWCIHKVLVEHYFDLNPMISYYKLLQHNMGQC